MSNNLFLKRCVNLQLVCFCFVVLLIRLSFIQIFALVVLSFITWRVPFTSERLCGGLFLGLPPLAPLSCRSPLFHVSCGFFLF